MRESKSNNRIGNNNKSRQSDFTPNKGVNNNQEELPGIEGRSKNRQKRFYVDRELLQHYAKVIKPHGIAIYSVLSSYVDRTQECYPSYPTIMEEAGIGRRNTISKYLQKLERLNIIYRKRRKNTSNLYKLIPYRKWRPPSVINGDQKNAQKDASIENDTDKIIKGSVSNPQRGKYRKGYGDNISKESQNSKIDTQSNINKSYNYNSYKFKDLKSDLKDEGII